MINLYEAFIFYLFIEMQRRINFHEASRPHQIRIKRRIRDKLLEVQNEILIPHGLKFRKIKIEKNQNFANESIEDFVVDIIMNQSKDFSIRKVIFIKDKHNISDVT